MMMWEYLRMGMGAACWVIGFLAVAGVFTYAVYLLILAATAVARELEKKEDSKE